jgi:hypothetical protein
MKKLKVILVSLLLVIAAAQAWADNVRVTNALTQPVPVTTVVRSGTTGLNPQYYSGHITTNATTTVTSSTAYISSVVVSVTAIGTTETLKIQNKEGTAKIIYQQGSPLALGTVTPVNGVSPVVMTSGIDIVTSGSGPATLDVWITYWQ